jgi:hypothetical protein
LKEPFIWDKYSNQPYPIADKVYKKRMRKITMADLAGLICSNLFIFPLSVMTMPFFKSGKKPEKKDFFGMGVDIDDGKVQIELIKELGVKHILLRMPLWEIDRIDEYVAFAKNFEDVTVLINVLQDREHIEDKKLFIKDMTTIFDKFGPFVDEFQIGNAVNRTKWGFFSIKEYLEWYQTVYDLRNEYYPNVKLIGPSVIDFEYHYTIRALFNGYKIKYDKLSALLYVDRRGAPENKQMGIFDTRRKIDMLFALAKLSSKCGDEIYITEVNWPISDTAPYAPTSEKECVNLNDYTKFMVNYHKIAYESGKIRRVYWHKLIAPGHGLVDNREGIEKYPAFHAYKRMIDEDGIVL